MKKCLMVLCLVVLAGCAQQKAGDEDYIAFPLDMDQWEVGHHSEVSETYRVTVFVPKGETLDNWTQSVTIQVYGGAPEGPPRSEMEVVRSATKEICGDDLWWNVITRSSSSITFEWRTQVCGSGVPQHELARILQGDWNRFQVSYAAKTDVLSPEQRATWLKFLQDTRVTTGNDQAAILGALLGTFAANAHLLIIH